MGSLLGDRDAKFFDKIASEMNKLAGTEIVYYALLHRDSPRDPLYDEPIEELHQKASQVCDPVTVPGICLSAFLEYPQATYRALEEGKKVDYDAAVWLVRAEYEKAFKNADRGEAAGDGLSVPTYRDPKIGDVVECQGRFYDVLSLDLEGQLNDKIRAHTMWYLKLKSRSEFEARRRIEGRE